MMHGIILKSDNTVLDELTGELLGRWEIEDGYINLMFDSAINPH